MKAPVAFAFLGALCIVLSAELGIEHDRRIALAAEVSRLNTANIELRNQTRNLQVEILELEESGHVLLSNNDEEPLP